MSVLRIRDSVLLRLLIVPLLVGGLAFPRALTAAPATPQPTPGSTPVTAPDGSFFVALGDNDKAKEFADRLIRSLPADSDREVHLYHIQGLSPDPRLQIVLQILAQNGIKVKGTFVTKARFEQIVSRYDDNAAVNEKIDKYLVNYEKELTPEERGWLSWLKPSNLKKSFGALKQKLFGLPRGISIFTHFVKKTAEGKWVRRFPADIKTTLFALGTSLWAIGNITLVRTLGPVLFGTQEQPMDAEFWIINGIVFVWVYLCLYFQREISSFRSQGSTVRVDASAPEGQQIEVVPNDSFFTAACIGQEWTLNGIITALQMGMGSVTPGMAAVGNAAMNGAIAAYAYIVPEDIKARWLAEAEKVQKEDPQRAAALNTRALILATVFWNLVFPTFKNLNFFLPGWLTALPFLVLGSAGLAWKHVKKWRQASRAKAANEAMAAEAPAPSELPHGCPALLVVRRKETATAAQP